MPLLSRKFLAVIPTLFTIPAGRPITSLPNELILIIAEELSPKDLSSLLKVNRHLASLLRPLFHKRGLCWARQFATSLPTSFFNASRRGDVAKVTLLLEIGAKIDAVDHGGETALYMAAQCGNLEVVELLLKQGANINFQSLNGTTPIDGAVRFVRTPVVKLLLENGASLLRQSSDRDTNLGLRWAAEFGTVELVELLLGSMSNDEIAGRDSKGRTALHFAVERTQKPAAVSQLLLEREVDINARDMTGRTALYYALTELMREYCFEKCIAAHRRRREMVVKLLIGKGAELDVETINLLIRCMKRVGRFSKIHGTLFQALDTLH